MGRLRRTFTCSIPGCGARHSARGYCRFHHTRWYQTGSALTPLANSKKRATNDIQTLRAYLQESRSEPNERGCMEWKYAVNGSGYGTKWFKGEKLGAHVLTYIAFVDEAFAPSRQNLIMHECDNRRCLNEKHLRPGTPKENLQDMAAKGRAHKADQRGSKNPKAKIHEDQIPWIRQMLRYGVSVVGLADALGVSKATIYGIKNNKFWRHV